MNDIITDQNTLLSISIAAIAGLFVRWIDKNLKDNTIKHDQEERVLSDMQTLNNSLKENVSMLQAENNKLSDEIDLWKDKYYKLIQSHIDERQK